MSVDKKIEPVASLRPMRIKNLHDCSRLLGRVLMQLQKGEVSDNKAKTISYCANSYAKVFELSDLETRLNKIEAVLAMNRPKNETGPF
jgi:hypothetical protein